MFCLSSDWCWELIGPVCILGAATGRKGRWALIAAGGEREEANSG